MRVTPTASRSSHLEFSCRYNVKRRSRAGIDFYHRARHDRRPKAWRGGGGGGETVGRGNACSGRITTRRTSVPGIKRDDGFTVARVVLYGRGSRVCLGELSPRAEREDCSASVTRSDLSAILAVDYREILRPGPRALGITDPPTLMLNSIHTLDSFPPPAPDNVDYPPCHFVAVPPGTSRYAVSITGIRQHRTGNLEFPTGNDRSNRRKTQFPVFWYTLT